MRSKRMKKKLLHMKQWTSIIFIQVLDPLYTSHFCSQYCYYNKGPDKYENKCSHSHSKIFCVFINDLLF